MNLRCGKQLRVPCGIFAVYRRTYGMMSPESRATSLSTARRRAASPGRASVSLFRAAGPAGKLGSKLRRAAEISLTTPGLDLATRLRVFQRALRSLVERRDALIDIVRAVN